MQTFRKVPYPHTQQKVMQSKDKDRARTDPVDHMVHTAYAIEASKRGVSTIYIDILFTNSKVGFKPTVCCRRHKIVIQVC